MEKVDFKKIAHVVRFDLLGSSSMPTPAEFETLSESERFAIYRLWFGIIHDTSTFLSSALDTDKLLSKYNVDCEL